MVQGSLDVSVRADRQAAKAKVRREGFAVEANLIVDSKASRGLCMRHPTRHGVLLLLTVSILRWGAIADDSPKPRPDRQAARAAQALQLSRRAAEQYTIRLADGDATPVLLQREALLKFSNPLIGSTYGAVFVYTAKGRPEAIVSIYKWYAPARHMGVEFHSLSLGLLTAEHDGKEVWSPRRPGIDLRPLPDASPPAGSPAGRLRQIRALADQFSASETNESNITRDLRLLTKPLYRYASEAPRVVDGALFAFVQGTDPEAILVIEAVQDPDGRAAWRYALARMTFRSLKVSHRDREVWTVPLNSLGPNSEQQDRRAPYTEFVFQPGEGLNPLDESEVP